MDTEEIFEASSIHTQLILRHQKINYMIFSFPHMSNYALLVFLLCPDKPHIIAYARFCSDYMQI